MKIKNTDIIRQDIGGYDKLVYLILLSVRDVKTGNAIPTQDRISYLAGCSTATVKRCIKSLVNKKVITVRKIAGNRNEYGFII